MERSYMSWIRRTTAGRGRVYLTLTATPALVIGLAWAAAPATPPTVQLAAAAKPAGDTTPGTASPGRIAGFVLDHGRYLPVAPPRGLEDLVSSPLSPVRHQRP
jgi:hypothetical protein